ncbi:hypothetical protein GCM10009825_21990 [Arthrobacter humicola]|uniref:Chromosome segregation ATPase n=1 Tax=Arthrobacter humicola TaxID=409291 RepID=A0ABN2Z4I6_9MICC
MKIGATASTALIASGGLILLSPPASAAEPATCSAAQASYRTALSKATDADSLARQVKAASRAAVQAQQVRDALAAAAVADTVQAQADLDAAAAAAAKTEGGLEAAKGNVQRALTIARWAADAVDRIQTELDGLPQLNDATENQARTQLSAATAARSDAAVNVTAAQASLEAARASHDQPDINAAQAALLAKQNLLEAAEAQLGEATLALEGVKAQGDAQLADARNRLNDAQQLSWEMDEHLMQADESVRAANDNAQAAADAAAQAKNALLTARNPDGIAAADAVLAAARTTATALHAQTTTRPDPASIARLLHISLEACAATPGAAPPALGAVARPVVALAPATVSRPAAVGVPSSNPEQKPAAVTATNPGLNIQTGVVTVSAAQVPAGPRDQDGMAIAAWSLGGLMVLAVTSFGVRRGRLRARMTNGAE